MYSKLINLKLLNYNTYMIKINKTQKLFLNYFNNFQITIL